MTTVYIPIEKYFNAAGEHTCAKDFRTGEVCEFYRVRSFGTNELCSAVDSGTTINRKVLDSEGELGNLIPVKGCPLVKAEQWSDIVDDLKAVAEAAGRLIGSVEWEPSSPEEEELEQTVIDLDG